MTPRIAVLRPEPGNTATAQRIAAAGGEAVCLPLFTVAALPWMLPAGDHDALILTSANAVRHGGPQLESLGHLPVYAVGAATATAACEAGLRVVHSGEGDGEALVVAAAARGVRAALHLTGREHRLSEGGIIRSVRAVYASEPVAISRTAAQRLTNAVALVHSPRAAARLAELVDAHQVDRRSIAVAAISERAGGGAGPGWRRVGIAERPADDALIALALRLAD